MIWNSKTSNCGAQKHTLLVVVLAHAVHLKIVYLDYRNFLEKVFPRSSISILPVVTQLDTSCHKFAPLRGLGRVLTGKFHGVCWNVGIDVSVPTHGVHILATAPFTKWCKQ